MKIYGLLWVWILLPAAATSAATEPIIISLTSADDGSTRLWMSHTHGLESGDLDAVHRRLNGWRYDQAENPNGTFAADVPIIIRADGRVPFGQVMQAYHATRRAKYTNVMFAGPDESLVGLTPIEKPHAAEQKRDADGDPLGATDEKAEPIALIGAAGTKTRPIESPNEEKVHGVAMYGVGANAKTIAYVIDTSTAMIQVLPDVLNELQQSIAKLDDAQRFTVICYRDGSTMELPVPHRGLKRATEETAQKAADWLSNDENLKVGGTADPRDAITRAIAYRPEVIFVLSTDITSGGALETPALLNTIAEAMRRRGAQATRINTIQLGEADPHETLRAIAEAHDGRYRFVDTETLEHGGND